MERSFSEIIAQYTPNQLWSWSKYKVMPKKIQPKLLPYVSDPGNAVEPGFGLLTKKGERDWHWFFGSDEPLGGWSQGIAPHTYSELTPFGFAKRYGGMHIHNPASRFRPMALDQFALSSTEALHTATPSPMLEATIDWAAFTAAASKYKSETNLYLGMYVGGTEVSFGALKDETPREYKNRVLAVLKPILDIRPRIDWLGLDAVLGAPYMADHFHYSVVGGPKGGTALVVKAIQDMGIQVAVEPAYFKSASRWLGDCSVLLRDRFRDLHDGRGPAWQARNKEGQMEDLVHPLDTVTTPLLLTFPQWNTDDDVKLDIIEEAQVAGYNVLWSISRWPASLL